MACCFLRHPSRQLVVGVEIGLKGVDDGVVAVGVLSGCISISGGFRSGNWKSKDLLVEHFPFDRVTVY